MNKSAHIRITKSKGLSGAYGKNLSDRWKTSLVSDSGEISLDHFMTEGFGYSALRHAMHAVKPYVDILGIPVRHTNEGDK